MAEIAGTPVGRARIAAWLGTISCLGGLGSVAFAEPGDPPVSDQQVQALVTAVGQGNAAGLRRVVGDAVLIARQNDFERSSPEAMIEALRGCAHHLTDRVPGNDAVFLDFVCPDASREGVREEEDPGYMMRLWRHPLGLAVSYLKTGIQVRPRTRPLAPPPPPKPPEPRV